MRGRLVAAVPADLRPAPGDRVLAARLVERAHGPVPARDELLRLLRDRPEALERDCRPGHVTASAAVVDLSTRRTVLLEHRKLGRWLQPGGHVDGDGNLAAAALREASEETGIAGLQVLLPAVDLDVHDVAPAGEAPHLHLDIRFVVLAPPRSALTGNEESTAIRWVALSDPDPASTLGLDASTHRLFSVADSLLPAG